MAVRNKRGNLPFVSYQHGSGTDEVLRPTLMAVSDGRSYRKMTESSFGPKRETERVANRLPVYVERDECPREEEVLSGTCWYIYRQGEGEGYPRLARPPPLHTLHLITSNTSLWIVCAHTNMSHTLSCYLTLLFQMV